MYGMGYGGMSGANMSGVGMNQGMNQGGMVHGQMSGACCHPHVAPITPVAAYGGVGAGIGVGIIAIAILILIALGVIF